MVMRGGKDGWDISNKAKDAKLFLSGTDKKSIGISVLISKLYEY